MRVLLLGLVAALLSACPASKPSELSPFPPGVLTLLPSLVQCNPNDANAAKALCDASTTDKCDLHGCNAGFFCDQPTQQSFEEFSVRNIGDAPVKIASVTFEASDQGAGSDAFSAPAFDKTTLFKNDTASLAFKYLTSDITKQNFAKLVIKSDAAKNPTLTLDISTITFLANDDNKCHENICDNHIDDDNDGKTDCDDPDCKPFAVCGGTETQCNDGIDNDHDGLIDCADPDCANAPNCLVAGEGEGEGEGAAGEGEGEGAAGEGEGEGAAGEGEGEGGQ
jgi:hypothetical protein